MFKYVTADRLNILKVVSNFFFTCFLATYVQFFNVFRAVVSCIPGLFLNQICFCFANLWKELGVSILSFFF